MGRGKQIKILVISLLLLFFNSIFGQNQEEDIVIVKPMERCGPSPSWLVGLQSRDGLEFGADPNLSSSGTAVIIASGLTIQSAEINLPVNISLATSKSGPRFLLLFGFGIRDNKQRKAG